MRSFLSRAISISRITPRDLFPVFVMLPVAVFYFISPDKFEIEWVGYSTFAFSGFFTLLVWLVYRMKQPPLHKISAIGVAWSFAAITLYQLVIHGLGYLDAVTRIGATLGFHDGWLASWGVAVDVMFYAAYLMALAMSFFGLRSLRRLSAPIIYLFLTASAIVLDDFYPSASFTAFQMVVPYITMSVGNILPVLNMTATTSSITDPNGQIRSILVVTEPRFLAMEINWPCAGIFSVLIFSAVMFSLLQTETITKLRKTIYLIVGLLGTISVNIIRIVALIVLYVDMNADLLVFHQFIGGLFFVAWITIFLSIIFLVERRRRYVNERTLLYGAVKQDYPSYKDASDLTPQ